MQQPMRFTPPPRRVPVSLAIVNYGNVVAQIGWFFFGFGMIFFWIFAGSADFSFITFRGELEETQGRVVRVEETGASENETPVIAHHYEYSLAGQKRTGTSYATGERRAEGDGVTVEYAPGNPDRSRIAGMRRATFGPGVIVVTIFPLIGLIILYFAVKSGIKRNRLLRVGEFTTGRLIDKSPTNMMVNKRRVWALTFEFTARDGRTYQCEARSTDPERMEDEQNEPLLYDPENPTKAYVLDEAPARPQFDGLGEVMGRPAAAVGAMIIPGFMIAVNVVLLYFKLR